MGKILMDTKNGSFIYLLHRIGKNCFEVVTEEGSWVTKESITDYEELAETSITIPVTCPDEGFDAVIIRQAVKRIQQAKSLFSPIAGDF